MVLTTNGAPPENGKKKKVLVVGDWLFDENWVTGEHRRAAGQLGSGHLRALHHHDTALYGLASAGKTAAVLYHGLDTSKYHIAGIGVWDQADTDAIKAFLDMRPEVLGQSQYRITCPTVTNCNVELFNLGKLIEKKEADKEPDKRRQYRCGTMRAIRIYHHNKGRLLRQKRIDWDPPPPHDETAWVSAGGNAVLTIDDLKDLEGFVKDASAIVVEDIGKGVVSPMLIKWLIKSVPPSAEWFLSSKRWRPTRDPEVLEEQPDWFHELQRANMENVKLLLIPHMAAERAVEEGGLSRWIDFDGPSREALKRLNQLSQYFPQASIVVMPKGLTVLARFVEDKRVQCLVQAKENGHTLDGVREGVGVPMTSIFFPAIIFHMLEMHASAELALEKALTFTHCWMTREVERIEHSERGLDCSLPELSLTKDLSQDITEKRFAEWKKYDWETVKLAWDQAFKECGIMEPTPGKTNGESVPVRQRCIEVWRATTDVPNYVCCVPSKRHAIRRLQKELVLFKTEARHPRSLMIVAAPGSGKTHCMKQLAKSYDLAFVHFNITQMLSKADILDCFDTIVTREAQDDQSVLVFFDEINARLNGQHVYDSFLAPIEEGVYIRGGKTFRLPACAWLFAGTEDPAEDKDLSAKGSDFVSRLSIAPIDFRPEAGEEADVNTEHVYLGVNLLKQAFPDITEVSEKVLRAFEFLRPDVDVRQVKHFVDSFVEVQHEQVLSRNIPLEHFKGLTHPHSSHRHHFDRWRELEERKELVSIRIESPEIQSAC